MKALVLLLSVALAGCSPALFKTVKSPEGKTTEQTKLEEIQCGQASTTNGPWLFGLGYAIYKNMAATRYKTCMESNGHQVERIN